MVCTLWILRSHEKRDVDLEMEYAGIESMCTFRFHHKGIFTQNRGRRYVDGVIDHYDYVDMDLFSVLEVDEMVKELGYVNGEPIFYHFRIPGTELEYGLLPLASDRDVHVLSGYVPNNKLIDVYLEHGISRVNNYYKSPSKVIIEEVEDQVSPEYNRKKPTRKETGSCSRKLDVDFDTRNLPMVPYVTDLGQSYLGRKVANQSSWGGVDHEQVYHVHDNLTFENQENTNPEEQGHDTTQVEPGFETQETTEDFDPFEGLYRGQHSDGASNADSTNVSLSMGIDDEESQEYESGSEEDQSEDEDDYDFLVDENNILDEPDVDMSEFVSVVDEQVRRDPDSIPIQENNTNIDDELLVIDTQVFETLGDDGERRKKYLQEISKPVTCSEGEIHLPAFKLGQRFKSKADVRELVNLHSIHTKRALYYEKNDKTRIRVKCEGVVPDLTQCGPWTKSKIIGKPKVIETTKSTCPWLLFISRRNTEEDWMVKTIVKEHNCVQSRKIKACTAEFLGNNIVGQVESNPTIPIRALHEDLQKKFGVGFSRMKAFRAKQIAQKHLFGDYQHQYSLLRDYGLEIQRSNVGSTFKIDVHNEPIASSNSRTFRRVYVCLGPLKAGFKAGLREFLGFDGAFVKGPYPGQVLTAVGLDSNNGIYPLAYSIVEAETLASWTWFLECLADDLDLDSSSNFTFTSDRQKGLLPAIAKIFPNAEHRFCLRHIYENMRLQWRDTEYKDYLWKIASTTTPRHFETAMEAMRKYDVKAYEWLRKVPPTHWSRSHFSGRAKTDSLTNNLCEVFNSKILDARDKPIITCLEFIREYLMRRIVIVQKEIDRSKGPLTPTATKMLDEIKKHATQNTCIFNGADKTQVTTPKKEQFVVNFREKSCTCRYWELTGIVCPHAVSAIWDKINHGGKNVPEIEAWVHPIYRLQTWRDMYNHKVDPINGRSMWPKSDCPTTLGAPKHHTQVGRPKKKRRKAAGEVTSTGKNLSRKYLTVTCSKCGNKGHNQRSCKGQGGAGEASQSVKRRKVQAGNKKVGKGVKA